MKRFWISTILGFFFLFGSSGYADVIVYTAWDCDTSYGDYSATISSDVLNFKDIGWSETVTMQGGHDGIGEKEVKKFHDINDKILSIAITESETIRLFKDKNFRGDTELLGPRNGCYNLGSLAKKVSSLRFVQRALLR
jgi:hypothetical protein